MMPKPSFHRICLLLGIMLAGALVSSCQPAAPQWPIGLSELSPDGRWVVISEHHEEPLGWRLVLNDLERGRIEVVAEGLPANPEVHFSPGSGYLLYRIDEAWTRVDLTSLEQLVLSTQTGALEFLPGERMLRLIREEDRTTFQITDLSRPRSPTLSIDRVQYIFTSGLSDLPGDRLAAQAMDCSSPRDPGQASWALIRDTGDVSVLIVTPDRIDQRSLGPRLAAGVIQVLTRQASQLEARLAQAREELRDLIAASGQGEEDVSDDADIFQYVLDSVSDQNVLVETIPDPNAIIDLTLLGTLSPDGTKLLFLRYEPGELDLFSLMGESQEDPFFFGLLGAMVSADEEQQESRFYLYLINLETGEEPALLSSETSWAPVFTFSPNGQQILFESNLYGRTRALYLADAENQDRVRLSQQAFEALCWR